MRPATTNGLAVGRRLRSLNRGDLEMSTDPKKNDEIKDEELENVSGGAGKKADEESDGSGGGGGGTGDVTTPSKRPQRK